jgi:pterin-4a-carbinolamine dehydratase
MQKILKNFTLNNTHLIYHYKFAANNYLQTLERMHRIGLIADEMDHHPEWTLNGNSLIIGLSTH